MSIHPLPIFGELLKRHRVATGLTQEELAERAGISARAVSDMERGLRRRPYLDTIAQLARALGLSDEDRVAVEHSARTLVPPPAAGAPSPRVDETGAALNRQRLPTGGFAGSLPVNELVARQSELTHLLETVEVVSRGEGRVQLLAGEPGAGKTRLMQEVTVAVRERGLLVAAARART